MEQLWYITNLHSQTIKDINSKFYVFIKSSSFKNIMVYFVVLNRDIGEKCFFVTRINILFEYSIS